MTTIDWRALRPHVPLIPGDQKYVERAGGAGAEIAQWILADRSPLLVAGPAGVGKSTELARAAALLHPDRFVCIAQIDRFENMRRLKPGRMHTRLLERLGIVAKSRGLPLSPELLEHIDRAPTALSWQDDSEISRDIGDVLNAAVSEVARLEQKPVTLLIDGLEKVPPGPGSFELFDALGSIRDDVELVAVVPWHAAFGPRAETVIRAGERFVAMRALDVDGPTAEPGRAFLRKLLALRLRLDRPLDGVAMLVMDEVIRWSGGLPRVFLQLIADAGSYAKLRRADEWPNADDMHDAIADQVDSFRRLLLPGDTDAIRAAAGTNGSELDLDRKIRLMAHGILLERVRDGARVLDVHPLAQAAFDNGSAHA